MIRIVRRASPHQTHPRDVALLVRKEVDHAHRKEALPVVAVVLNRGHVGIEEAERTGLHHPHRERISLEHQPEGCFTGSQFGDVY